MLIINVFIFNMLNKFTDFIKIYCKSGDGGSGIIHFRKEKFINRGGPDGGDGGSGMTVLLHPSEEMV